MINLIGLSGYMGSGKSTVGTIIQYLTTHPTSLNKTDYKDNRSFNSFIIDVGCGFVPKWEIKGFATKLKEIASILTGIPAYKFEDQEFKASYMPNEWNRWQVEKHEKYTAAMERSMQVRSFLQKLGTEAVRDIIHENAWINALFADYIEDTGYSYKTKKIADTNNGVKMEVLSKPQEFNNGYPKWVITDVRFPNEAQAIKAKGGIIVRINRPIEPGSPYFSAGWRHPSEVSLDNWEFDYTILNNDGIEELIENVREMLIKYEII